MDLSRQLKKIGNFLFLSSIAGAIFGASAQAEVQFSATVDQSQISEDSSVSLKMSVKADGNLRTGDPQFDAPDFEVVNQYDATYIQSYYENGQIGMKNTHELT